MKYQIMSEGIPIGFFNDAEHRDSAFKHMLARGDKNIYKKDLKR